MIVSLDVIIDETRGYDGIIPDTQPENSVINSLSDPFIFRNLATETPNVAGIEDNGDDLSRGDDQVESIAMDDRDVFLVTESRTTTQGMKWRFMNPPKSLKEVQNHPSVDRVPYDPFGY